MTERGRSEGGGAAARRGIACGGNWIIDHVKTITFWPREETLTNIVAEELGTGGSAYNVLVDLARFGLGIPLAGVGLVGDDADGDRILADLARRGIDARHVRKARGAPTSYTDVMTVEGTGRRTFFHNRGANALLAPEHFPVEEISARLFNLGYLLLLDSLDADDPEFGTRAARVLARLRAAGIVTAIDVVSEDSDRFARIVTPALPHADYCIINEIEAGRTVGRELRAGARLDEGAMEAAAADLLERGVKRAAVVHAPELSVALTGAGKVARQPALRLPAGFIKGTAGAGDAFLAGMLAGIHEGWDLERALRFATAAAASCLRHPTTTAGVGTVEEIWELAERCAP
jgi:sugar/nucleoside kinase (ribokinase family)